ncbi:hypothetical protein Vretimale_16741 [Volvox reticuliferus]|uniref:AB hydrolase-1 domain-containing protein n=1 Tax=Volvox reticuliferus TaxID=1737510 RepID=A0A8J4LWH6_9CHLO|nr:hypothetical protein Vretimale_16741 [Volvox reticuliferus]
MTDLSIIHVLPPSLPSAESQVVISSSFESSVGLAALVQLAATVGSASGDGGGSSGGPSLVHHGLGTLQWFAADVALEPLQWAPRLLPPQEPPPSSLQAPSASSAAGPSMMMASSPQPSGAEFLPLQAVCGTVEQADRLLQACAAGRGIRREALLAAAGAAANVVVHNGAICGEEPSATDDTGRLTIASGRSSAPHPRAAETSPGRGSAATGPNAAADHINMRNYGVDDASVNGRLEGGGGFINGVSNTSDPWVGPYTHGGVLERPFCVEVELPSVSPSSSLTTRPVTLVQVHGLEVHPPLQYSATSSAGPSTASTLTCGGETNARRRHGHQQQQQQSRRPFMFLHGFLGSSLDWRPLMRALAAAGHRCVAIDLPGHGATLPALPVARTSSSAGSGIIVPWDPTDGSHVGDLPPVHCIPGAASCVAAAARLLGLEGAVVVGYSLGARVALQAAVDDAAAATSAPSDGGDEVHNNGAAGYCGRALWSGVVLVSGTPGIKDPAQAAARAANDDRLAKSLVQGGVEEFVRRWYEQPLWSSLRRHPAFGRLLARRLTPSSATSSASAAAPPRRKGDDTSRAAAPAVATPSSRRDAAEDVVATGGFVPVANFIAVDEASNGASCGGRGSAGNSGSGSGPGEASASGDGSGSGGEVAIQLAAALSGMSTGRMAPLWDRLDPWVGPPVILVVGGLDAKFVDINTYTLARLVRKRTAAVAAAAGVAAMTNNTGDSPAGAMPQPPPAPFRPVATTSQPWGLQQWQEQQQGSGAGRAGCTMPVSEQLRQLGHALVRLEGVGHAVHVEAPQRLLDLLRETSRTLEELEDQHGASLTQPSECGDHNRNHPGD